MATRNQERLFETFQSLAPGRGLSGVLGTAGTIVSAAESGGSGSGVGSTVASIFTSGLGLIPLVSGLLGLFGGGGPPIPPPLVKYTMPEQLYFQGADTSNGVSSADYDQFGTLRGYVASNRSAAGNGVASQSTGVANPSGAPSQGSAAPAQISVNVQTMDARSFLDHSTEIAQAVRQAMLTLNSVNDVVNDL